MVLLIFQQYFTAQYFTTLLNSDGGGIERQWGFQI